MPDEPPKPDYSREAALFDAAAACLRFAMQRVEERESREGVSLLDSTQRVELLQASAKVTAVADVLYGGK